jgi:ATP-dependent Lon protease
MSRKRSYPRREPNSPLHGRLLEDLRYNRSISSSHAGIAIFDPADVRNEIQKLSLTSEQDEILGLVDPQAQEDKIRLKVLKRLLAHPLGFERPSLFGNPDMAQRVLACKKAAPHFGELIDIVARAVTLSHITNSPLRLPPILLVGEPGIGKTHISKRVAQALGTGIHEIALNMTDAFRLRGLNTAWKGARMGQIANAILESHTASPIILIDEFDKPATIHQAENPLDIFHALFEQENSRRFVDDYLEFPLRADQIIWISSANGIRSIPPSIIDRLLIVHIPSPSEEHLGSIIENIYSAANASYGGRFEPTLAPEIRAHLTNYNPRRTGRLFDLSFARAAFEGRSALTLADILETEHLVSGGGESTWQGGPVGFRLR